MPIYPSLLAVESSAIQQSLPLCQSQRLDDHCRDANDDERSDEKHDGNGDTYELPHVRFLCCSRSTDQWRGGASLAAATSARIHVHRSTARRMLSQDNACRKSSWAAGDILIQMYF
jgi:hypothetical protein